MAKNKIFLYAGLGLAAFLAYEFFKKPATVVPAGTINPATGQPYYPVAAQPSTLTTLTSTASALTSIANSVKNLFGGSSTPAASGAAYNPQTDVVKTYAPTAGSIIDTSPWDTAGDYQDPAEIAPDQLTIGPTAGAAVGGLNLLC